MSRFFLLNKDAMLQAESKSAKIFFYFKMCVDVSNTQCKVQLERVFNKPFPTLDVQSANRSGRVAEG